MGQAGLLPQQRVWCRERVMASASGESVHFIRPCAASLSYLSLHLHCSLSWACLVICMRTLVHRGEVTEQTDTAMPLPWGAVPTGPFLLQEGGRGSQLYTGSGNWS